MAESTGGDTQRYKYNGKELDRMHGLDWFDYGARWMTNLIVVKLKPAYIQQLQVAYRHLYSSFCLINRIINLRCPHRGCFAINIFE